MSLPDLVQARHHGLPRERVIESQPIIAAPPPQQDFVDTLRKLWRHRRLILACTIAFAIITTIVAVRMPSHYVAEARVLVGVEQPKVLTADSILSNTPPDAEIVQGEAYVVQSRDLARKVIDQLNLASDPEFNPALVLHSGWMPRLNIGERLHDWFGAGKAPAPALDPAKAAALKENQMVDIFLSKLDVSTLGRTHVLSIQASAENPDVAAAIANTLAKDYIEQARNNKIATTDEVEKFLADRIAELRKQVEKSEQAVEDYRRQYGLYNGANTGVTSQQLTELNTQLILAQTAKAEADARLNEALSVRRHGLNGESVPAVLQSALIQNLKQQQAEAERKLAELSASYGPKHPAIIDQKANIADIREKIKMEVARIIDGLRNEAMTADARYETLRKNFDRTKTQMGGVNEKSIHLDALERDATVNRNLLQSMLSRAKEIIGQQELQRSDAKIISSAAPPLSPAFPPKPLLVFLGTLGGALVGIILSLLQEGADRTFRRGSQIEAVTGLPVLAMVPNLGRGPSPVAHVLRKPVSPYSEALRKLHIGLELSGSAQSSPKTVMFCSATPGEGKSVLAASLGRLLASNGRRVLLIDCDWRSPSLHRLFHCSNKDGLAALLTDEKVALNEIIYNDALSGLDVIPAGNWRPTAVHALTSERMRLILRAFAKSYDFVILDTPPVLVGAEVLTLSRIVDKVVFAVRWGHTRQEVALEGLKQIIEAQGDVAGVVLTRVDPKRYRQYGYGRLDYEYVRPALTRLG